MQPDQPGPQIPTVEVCYRHPNEETRVHCARCGRPICPSCMIPAPVGHQCPECVGRARREFRIGPRGGLRRAGGVSVTRALLVVIIAMFLLEVSVGGAASLGQGPSAKRLVDLGALFPPYVAVLGQYWRLITAMFLHAGLLHIALNGYALWLFGSIVEDTFGRGRFLVIYFVTGFLASVASYTFGPPEFVGVGASGAIVGLLGAFIAYNFRRRHLALASANLRWAVMIILINVFIGLSFPGVDNRAHLGGLVTGIASGFLADGVGPPRLRPLVRVLGFALMLVIGVALVAWRTADLRSVFGPA